MTTTLQFKDWEFRFDKQLTQQTYENVVGSGADTCFCNDCKNYVALRDSVFPDEVHKLFDDLGVDYRKEVEITTWEVLPNGLHHIGGWFHFKGQMLAGKNYRVPLPDEKSFSIVLTEINANFKIGFGEGSDLTFFEDKNELIQIEFETKIPWVIDDK